MTSHNTTQATVRGELSPEATQLFAENPILRQMSHHRSIRSYTDEPVTETELQTIIAAVEASPWGRLR